MLFRPLYIFVIIHLQTRRSVHTAVTRSPTDDWTALNGFAGVTVNGRDSTGNTVRQNAIYDNSEKGILIMDAANASAQPPTITEVHPRTVSGTASPGSAVDVYSDDGEQGRYLHGSVMASPSGMFSYTLPSGTFEGTNVTAIATDGEGNTSEFSFPETVPPPVLVRGLPETLRPAQVSVEPAVVGTNLALALFSVLFFGLTSTVFNTILEDYRDEIQGPIGRILPQPASRLLSRTDDAIGALLARGILGFLAVWLVVLLITSIIESFLDPSVAFLAPERLGLIFTLLVAAVMVSGMEVLSDLGARRRLTSAVRAVSKVQWAGIPIAALCVLLSRAVGFKPGYLLGIVAFAFYHFVLNPDSSDIQALQQNGVQAVLIMIGLFGAATAALWMLFPWRLGRQRAGGG